MTDLDLPASVLALVELSPIEDIALAILRDGLVDVPSFSLIPEAPPSLFVLVRRDAAFGGWEADQRFTDFGRIRIDTFTADPDGDEKGALLSEAVRVVMREAWLSHKHIPGRGYITRIDMTAEPSRKTDWATSSGPVQFADLPTGFWRYESKYALRIRREV